MDPNVALAELLTLAYTVDNKATNDDGEIIDAAFKMAELVIDLDSWIRKGGFLPAKWKKGVQ